MMDAVEFSCPVDVAVSAKLMGSEGCGGVRVRENETENDCEPTRVSIDVNSSVERCSTSVKRKGNSSNASESSLWSKLLHSHNFLHERLTKLRIENSPESRISVCSNILPHDPRPESAELQRKVGKMSRSSSGASKRAKVALLEDTVSSARDNDIKDISEQGSLLSDKPQTVKHRNSFSGKRGDKRNSKLPLRTMPNLSSASGENAFFGVYGLKPEINDVTKLVDDLPLNDLLGDSYECPALSTEKRKKVENANETFLNSVRKACSVLPTLKLVQSQSSAEIDGYARKRLGSPSSVSLATYGESSDKENPCETDLSSTYEDHSTKAEIPSIPLNFPLCEADDVLECLSLPPPRDLDFLLQEASKPSQYSRNNSDLRSVKQLLGRGGLPPFLWSHTFNGNCRTNSEAAKLLTSRTLCQGRWIRIGNTVNSPGGLSDCFTNLESLTFNQNLVPFEQKQTIKGNGMLQMVSGSCPRCRCASSSLSTLDKASCVSLDTDEQLNDQNNGSVHCPLLVAAAQTLYNIACQSQTQSPNGILRWPKKLSQKSMRARKSKSLEKPEERRTTSMSLDLCCNNNQVRKDTAAEQIKPSKRPKLSTAENKKVSSPSTSGAELLTAERRDSLSNNKIKQSCIMPPPIRGCEKASTCQPKARKLMAKE